MADKASRALVILGDGFAPHISSCHSNFHVFASQASCGFLSVRDLQYSDEEDERVIGELRQLLDLHDSLMSMKQVSSATESEEVFSQTTLEQRFMGLKAAFYSTFPGVNCLERELGFSIIGLNQSMNSNRLFDYPDSSVAASEFLRLLGFFEGKVLDKSDYDLVFVHIYARENEHRQFMWLDELIGRLMQIANPGSEIGLRLHLSLVMSYGFVPKNNYGNTSFSILPRGSNATFSHLIPRQSYTMKEGHFLDNIRHHHPMLIAQLQDAVTRKDAVDTFSFQDFLEHGSRLAMLADRFMHEIAFKLWKAPKYGA